MLGWLMALALAGDLYVNDVKVNPVDLQGMTLEKVDVAIDATGTIRIKAPGYKIQVVSPAPSPVASSAALPPPPGGGTHGYPPGAYGQPYGSAGPPPPVAVGQAPLDPSVPPATWWLVTEDGGTQGHQIEVTINGRTAQTIRSGEAQRIIDVGAHVRRGTNQVTIRSTSTSASGGALYVYIGTGSDRSGTVVMDQPTVQFGLDAKRSGGESKSFEFTY